jgi:hypothetical protein
MVPGFNTDFKYRGETYHVQTEDNGVGNPVVVTLLYHKGAILASRRTPYNDLLGTPGFERALMALMKDQHKDVMRALLAGAYDKDGAAPAIAGASGEDPAVAAAAVAEAPPKAVTKPVTQPAAQDKPVPPRAIPVATGAPLQRATPSAAVAGTTSAAATAAPAAAATPAPRAVTVTLDEAIRNYLKEFAATAAATAH